MKTPNPMFFLIFCCLGLFVIFVWFFGKQAKKPLNAENIQFVQINESDVKVEIARTPAQRSKGLMFREYLEENSGMLFIFDTEAKHSFWMANTKIPLDIIWISRDGIIVDISANTPPCTETGNLRAMCKTYPPKQKALYVLEVNGGWTQRYGTRIGDSVVFK